MTLVSAIEECKEGRQWLGVLLTSRGSASLGHFSMKEADDTMLKKYLCTCVCAH